MNIEQYGFDSGSLEPDLKSWRVIPTVLIVQNTVMHGLSYEHSLGMVKHRLESGEPMFNFLRFIFTF